VISFGYSSRIFLTCSIFPSSIALKISIFSEEIDLLPAFEIELFSEISSTVETGLKGLLIFCSFFEISYFP